MAVVNNTSIQVSKGTARTLDFTLYNDNGDVLDLTGISVTFSVKELADDDADDVITKTSADDTELKILLPETDGKIQVYLVPSDTSTLDTKQYVYLIETAEQRPVDFSLFEIKRYGNDYTPPTFTNTIAVNHDYGTADAYTYKTAGGSAIQDAQIRIYYKTDYDQGILDTPLATTKTTAYGRWQNTVYLFTGFTYTIVFSLTNQYGPDAVELTI